MAQLWPVKVDTAVSFSSPSAVSSGAGGGINRSLFVSAPSLSSLLTIIFGSLGSSTSVVCCVYEIPS